MMTVTEHENRYRYQSDKSAKRYSEIRESGENCKKANVECDAAQPQSMNHEPPPMSKYRYHICWPQGRRGMDSPPTGRGGYGHGLEGAYDFQPLFSTRKLQTNPKRLKNPQISGRVAKPTIDSTPLPLLTNRQLASQGNRIPDQLSNVVVH